MSPSPLEGRLLAASRNASNASTPRTAHESPRRISFAKISEPLEVPKLLALQTNSFDWLVGNEAWDAEVQQRTDAGEDGERRPRRSERERGDAERRDARERDRDYDG